jgi:magnesium chelatase subunit D
VGGKTPLSAGLYAAYELIRNAMLREPEMRVLIALVTDGKANHSMTEATPVEEVKSIAALIRELPSTECIVVDTENKSGLVQTGRAKVVAAELGADYFRIEDLRSENLASLVRARSPES